MGVDQAKTIYAGVKMTSVEATVTGDTAVASYTYDISEINQTNQKWVKQDGKWLLDN